MVETFEVLGEDIPETHWLSLQVIMFVQFFFEGKHNVTEVSFVTKTNKKS